ncbi:MAG: hypothetical protein R3Y65_08385 [Bacillota bacterium]
MKKFVAIILALTLITTCVACSQTGMTSGEFQAEFNKFDWENSAPTAVNMEAERLLDMLEDLPSDTQKELSDVKEQLEDYKLVKEDEIMEEDHLGEGIMPEDGLNDEIMPEEGAMDDELYPQDENIEEDDIMGGDMLRRGELNVRRKMLSETIGKKAKPEKTETPEGIARDGERPERPERPEKGEHPAHPHHRPGGEEGEKAE